MDRKIKIFDTTLRDGEQSPGCSMNIKEKLELARQLELLGVDVIEAGFACASPGDFAGVKKIAENLKSTTVCSLARALEKDIDLAYEAVKNAVSPRIHTFIATSDIHMQYKLRMSPEETLEQARQMVKYAKKYLSDVEFSAEDASRTRPEFLYKVLEAVIDSGATTVNIPDTVGYMSPKEMFELVKGIRENVPNIDRAEISVHCHNDLGLGVANTLESVLAGATQLECTVNGIGERAGNAALEEIVMNLATRKDIYKSSFSINTREIYKTSKLLSSITGVKVQPNKAVVGDNAFSHESGIHQHGVLANRETYEIMTPESVGIYGKDNIVLGKHSGKHAFVQKLEQMGYNLEENDVLELFEKFKKLADKQKTVSDKDIEALVCKKQISVPMFYSLDRFVINVGNTITTTSAVRIKTKDGEAMEAVSYSDCGPIDASYKAINSMIKNSNEFELDDFKIGSVTTGKDAQGEATVKIKKNGKVYNGHGVGVDIVESAISAYLDAINSLVYEEQIESSL